MSGLLIRPSLRAPSLVVAAWLVVTAVLLWQAARVPTDSRLDAYRVPGHPAEIAFEKAREAFPRSDLLIVALRSPRQDALTRHRLAELHAAREALEERAGLRIVADAFSTVPGLQWFATSDADPADRYGGPTSLPGSPVELIDESRALLIAQSATEEPTAAFHARKARTVLSPLVEEGWRLYLGGEPENTYWFESVNEQTFTVAVPILILAAAIVLRVFLGDLRWLLALGLSALPVVAAAIATLGWIGGSLNSVTCVLPVLVGTIFLGSALHLALPWRNLARGMMRSTRTLRGGFARSAQRRWRPAVRAHLTTAIGFASLAVSPVKTVAHLGIAAAVAILLSLVVVYQLLPACVLWLRPRVAPPSSTPATPGLLARQFDRLPAAPRAAIAVLVIGLCGTSASALWKLPAESDFLALFPSGHPLVESTRYLKSQGLPSGTVEIVFPDVATTHGPPPGWSDLEPFFASLDELEGTFLTPSTLLRSLGLPGALAGADNVLALLRSTQPQLHELFFSPDGNGLRAVGLVALRDAASWKTLEAKIEARLNEHAKRYLDSVIISGIVPRAASVQQSLLVTLAGSLLVSGGAILLMFLALTRSPVRTLALATPNLVPITAIGATQVLLGIPHNAASVLVYAITVGLVVDGTLHLSHAYLESERTAPGEAVQDAWQQAGRPVLVAAVVLAIGFSTLIVSPFKPNAHFGGLLAVGVVAGALSNLVLVPILLDRRKRRETREDTAEVHAMA